MLEEMIELTAEDAAHFGCTAELAHLRTIRGRGTSATRQIAVLEAALAAGQDRPAALRAVVDDLIAQTVADLGPPQPAG